MTTINPEVSPESVVAVAQLAHLIADAEQRSAFVANPVGTLEQAGVTVEHIPQSLLDNLTSLSEDELGIVSRHCEELVRAGFFVDVADQGPLCFF